jgi:choline kinase
MQAVILAAGLGRRLGRLTARSTKCMVSLHGRRLIEYTLDAVVECGLERAILVVGHGGDEVRAFVGDHYRGLPIHYVDNPEFATTNNVYSLLLAASWLRRDDSVVLESDVVFEPGLLRACLDDPAPDVAAVAPVQAWMDGTVVEIDQRTRRITRFLTGAEARGGGGERYKTVNLYKLSRAFLAGHFLPFLETYVQTSGRTSFYEEVLRVLVYLGGSTIVALSAGDRRWYEIDDPEDLDIAATIFAPDATARLEALEGRYGGYWRFPEVRDFYYLVNPSSPRPSCKPSSPATCPV